MTPLKRQVSRRTINKLDGSFCKDKRRALAVTLIPGTDDIPDLIELRPYGTRRVEAVALCDVYRFAVRSRVNRENLEKARAKKAKLAASRESRALDRQAKKLRIKP